LRLFLQWFLIAIDEPLTDNDTRIPVSMAPHLAVWTEDQGRTCGIAFFGLSDKGGSEDRTFDSLDGAHGDLFTEIEVNGTNFGLCIGGDLLLDFGRASKSLLDRGMEPPLLAMPDELGASQLIDSRQIAPSEAYFEPGPA
jgi:hypothetical protein